MDASPGTQYQQRYRLLKQGTGWMKISVDVDCTPEEARRFMGLPDLTSVHAIYLSKLEKMVDEGITADNVDAMVRAWSPVGDAGMAMWRQMFDQMSGAAKR